MRPLILLLLLSLSSGALAEAFEERVELARAAEKADETKFYQKVMFDAIGNHLAGVMKSCFAKTKNPQTDSFVLVADLTKEGKAEDVEVKPQANIAVCFSKGFTSAHFPPPPRFRSRPSFPVFIEMRIKP